MSWASLLRTPLTTVAQPTYDMGMESARLLLSRLQGYTGAHRVVTLAPTLRAQSRLGGAVSHGYLERVT